MPGNYPRFIRLWQAGTETAEIAQRLGIPPGTARSRAYTLQQQGKISRRPQGGRRVPARQDGALAPARAPAPTPAEAPADSSLPAREAPAITMVAVPELRELLQRFSGLEVRVAALEDGTRTTPAWAPATPPRVDIKQWTVRLSQTLIEAVKARATAEGKEPSHLVEEVLWQALSDRRSSTP